MQTAISTAGGVPIVDTVPDRLPIGSMAGPWRVEAELGRGGMGAVYGVVHDEIGKRAALKVIHRRLLDTQVERMLVEARVVNQCRHPNIVDIFETGALSDGRPFIVMERLDGMALSACADDSKILPDRAVEILTQVASALIAAHDAGIVHRDLKLDNIFLVDPTDDKPPSVKLLDWGIAKEIANDTHQTVEGQLVGTPQYLAPEQARGATVSPQTDVYSLGVVAWELFLETLPFEAETAAEVMAMHLRMAPPVPSEVWPDIPRELEDLLLAMLEKEPGHRPTMRQVVERLGYVRDALTARKRVPVERKGTAGNPRMARAIQWSDTEMLGIAPPRRWWRYAAGAAAAVAAAVMLLVSHADDSAAATMPPVAAQTPPAPVEPVGSAQVVVAVQPIQIPIPTPVPAVQAPATKLKGAAKKPPVAQRKKLTIDPNGTVQAY